MEHSSSISDDGADLNRPTAEASFGGDAEVGQLFDSHNQRAYNLAYRLLGKREDAADAVQEGYLRALRALRGGTAAPREPDRTGSWLLKIVSNVALDQLRERSRATTTPLGELDYDLPDLDQRDPANEAARRELRGDVVRALMSLPTSQRVALTLREYQGLTYDDIGEQLGLNRAATTALLFRARTSFRDAYEGVAARPTPTGCAELQPLLSALLDDELASDAWSRVEEHLRTCDNCRGQVYGLRRSRRLYATLPLLVPPASLAAAALLGAQSASASAASASGTTSSVAPGSAPVASVATPTAATGAAGATGTAASSVVTAASAKTVGVAAVPAAASSGALATLGALVTTKAAAVVAAIGVSAAVALSTLPTYVTGGGETPTPTAVGQVASVASPGPTSGGAGASSSPAPEVPVVASPEATLVPSPAPDASPTPDASLAAAASPPVGVAPSPSPEPAAAAEAASPSPVAAPLPAPAGTPTQTALPTSTALPTAVPLPTSTPLPTPATLPTTTSAPAADASPAALLPPRVQNR